MRIRLHTGAHIDGRIYEAGAVVVLPEGIKGPHRMMRVSEDRLDYSTRKKGARLIGELKEVPLYDVLPEDPESPGEGVSG